MVGSVEVSVVIPCYNHGRFLGEAIRSVLLQSFRDFEIVVVDDGSSDDTAQVARGFEGVRLLQQKNQGQAAARNAGLRESRGRHVVFLDADDRLLPDALETGLACARAHPECGFVSGHYRMIAGDGSPHPTVVRPCVEKDHYRALLRRNYIGMIATVLFRRETLEAVGGFDRKVPACEDYDVLLRIARRFPVHCHEGIVAEYRWHGSNTSLNHSLMLRTALSVLRAQRREIRGGRAEQEAYRAGVNFWRGLYGEPLLREVITGLRVPAQRRRALRGLLVLLVCYPRPLLRAVARRLRLLPRPQPGR